MNIRPREGNIRPSRAEQVICLLDVSGSMNEKDYIPTRLEGAKKALAAFLDGKAKEAPEDLVAVVTFSDYPEVLLDFTGASGARTDAVRLLPEVVTQGNTNMGAGLARCERMFLLPGPPGIFSWARRIAQGLATGRHEEHEVEARPRRIILISDGEPTDDPLPVAARLKQAGVIIETIGVGSREAIDEELLQRIASTDAHGTPRYRFVDSTRKLIAHYRELSRKIGR